MALDARTRSSLYAKFAELVGDDDANALMSQFPSIEADELVTKQFLRAELSDLRAELRGEMGALRTDMLERLHQQTVWLGGALTAATALLATIGLFA